MASNIDASTYTLLHLKRIRQKEQFCYMNFSKCDLSAIRELFPVQDTCGDLDPPLSYRISAEKLDEWRKLGERAQEQKLEQQKREDLSFESMNATEREAFHVSIHAYFQWLAKHRPVISRNSEEERATQLSWQPSSGDPTVPMNATNQKPSEAHDPDVLEALQQLSTQKLPDSTANMPDYYKVLTALDEVWPTNPERDALLKNHELVTGRNANVTLLENRFAKFPEILKLEDTLRTKELLLKYSQPLHARQPSNSGRAASAITAGMAAATAPAATSAMKSNISSTRKRTESPLPSTTLPDTAVTATAAAIPKLPNSNSSRKRKDPPTPTATTVTTAAGIVQAAEEKTAKRMYTGKNPEDLINKLRKERSNEKSNSKRKIQRLKEQVAKLKQEQLKEKVAKINEERKPQLAVIAIEQHFEERKKKAIPGPIIPWEERYSQLVEFQKGHGHTRVVARNEPTGLGRWVQLQRGMKRKIKEDINVNGCRKITESLQLTDERVEMLDKLGFEWIIRENKPIPFDERYAQLEQYKEQHGHCRIPRSHPTLGEWVHCQRNDYRWKKACIQGRRTELLEAIGFEWKPENNHGTPKTTFDERMEDLIESRRKHGHLNVPRPAKRKSTEGNEEEEKKTGDAEDEANEADDGEYDQKFLRWVARIRQEYHGCYYKTGKQTSLNAKRIKQLERIGFQWGEPARGGWELGKPRRPELWATRLGQLKAYCDEHGNCNVPAGYPAIVGLGHWVVAQRKQYRKLQDGKPCALTLERRQALEETGFLWCLRPWQNKQAREAKKQEQDATSYEEVEDW